MLAAWECPCDEYGCQNGRKTHSVHRATRLSRCRAMVGAPVLHSGPGIPLGGCRRLPSLDGESAVSLPALRPSGSLRPESMSSRPRWETGPGIPRPLFCRTETERTERTITPTRSLSGENPAVLREETGVHLSVLLSTGSAAALPLRAGGFGDQEAQSVHWGPSRSYFGSGP